MQEEEENTQEAAGILPSVGQQEFLHSRQREVSSQPQPEVDEPQLNPPKSTRPQGRPAANDTFSRLGIVPETQTMQAQDDLDEPPYDPTQHDLGSDYDVPRTPSRRSEELLSGPGTVASVVSKMKSKRKGKAKELHPIPRLSPSDFRPYLQPEDDDIDQFSSPEKDPRRSSRPAQQPTHDTIEDEFSQDIDNFMDWDGGTQSHEDSSMSLRDNGQELSLGPELPPPDDGSGPRKAMERLLSKVRFPSYCKPF